MPDAFVLQPKSESNLAYWPLVDQHDRIEEALEINDDWMQLGNWTLFQALVECADQRSNNAVFQVCADDVSIETFKTLLLDNLSIPEWSDKLEIFRKTNPENS